MRVGALLSVMLVVAACGSSYSDSGSQADAGAKPGARFGTCYGNGTCDVGLSCIDGLCVQADAGGSSTGSSSSSSGDALDDASTLDSSLPPGCPSLPPPPGNGIGCGFPTLCDYDHVCCKTSDEWTCETSCASHPTVGCDTPDDCAGFCCFSVVSSNLECPTITTNQSSCKVAGCASNQMESCSNMHGCPPGMTCKGSTVVLDGTTQTLGVKLCVPVH